MTDRYIYLSSDTAGDTSCIGPSSICISSDTAVDTSSIGPSSSYTSSDTAADIISVGLSSLYISSDTSHDPSCEPCSRDGYTKPSIGYCPTCVEFYCHSCLDAHCRLSVTKRHKIQTGDERGSGWGGGLEFSNQ